MVGIFLFACALFVLAGCGSAPAVVIETPGTDELIVNLADNAGTIETQIVTVRETVTKYLYQLSPEQKAEIDRQFGAAQLSITKERATIKELARIHALEKGAMSKKYGDEIARLAPFEPKYEKAKGQRNTLFFVCVSLVLIIGFGIYAKIKGFP